MQIAQATAFAPCVRLSVCVEAMAAEGQAKLRFFCERGKKKKDPPSEQQRGTNSERISLPPTMSFREINGKDIFQSLVCTYLKDAPDGPPVVAVAGAGM